MSLNCYDEETEVFKNVSNESLFDILNTYNYIYQKCVELDPIAKEILHDYGLVFYSHTEDFKLSYQNLLSYASTRGFPKDYKFPKKSFQPSDVIERIKESMEIACELNPSDTKLKDTYEKIIEELKKKYQEKENNL